MEYRAYWSVGNNAAWSQYDSGEYNVTTSKLIDIDGQDTQEEESWWDPSIRERCKWPGPGVLPPCLAERLCNPEHSLFSISMNMPDIRQACFVLQRWGRLWAIFCSAIFGQFYPCHTSPQRVLLSETQCMGSLTVEVFFYVTSTCNIIHSWSKLPFPWSHMLQADKLLHGGDQTALWIG